MAVGKGGLPLRFSLVRAEAAGGVLAGEGGEFFRGYVEGGS